MCYFYFQERKKKTSFGTYNNELKKSARISAKTVAKMASFKHPWMVESIEAFSFYCCPECTFRSKEENFFEAHALQNHDLSRYLFQENFVQDIKIDIKVESSEAKHDLKDQFGGEHFLSNTNVQVKTEFEDFIDDAGNYF